MTKKRRNLRILASIIAAGCVWATGMSNAWAAEDTTGTGQGTGFNIRIADDDNYIAVQATDATDAQKALAKTYATDSDSSNDYIVLRNATDNPNSSMNASVLNSYYLAYTTDGGKEQYYWVQKGYNIVASAHDPTIGDATSMVIDQIYGLPENNAFKPLSSVQVHEDPTGVQTVLGDNLDDVTISPFGAASNSSTFEVDDSHVYIFNNGTSEMEVVKGTTPVPYTNSATNAIKNTLSFTDVFKEANGTKTVGLYYDPISQSYTYDGKHVHSNSVYYVKVGSSYKAGVFVVNGKVYDGTIYGDNGEVLLTGQVNQYDLGTGTGTTLMTYWGAENDNYALNISDSNMTIGNLREAYQILKSNDDDLAKADIKEIVLTGAANSGTINLLHNDEVEGTQGTGGQSATNVPGGITVTGGNDAVTGDTNITFENDGGSFTIDTGSVVSGTKIVPYTSSTQSPPVNGTLITNSNGNFSNVLKTITINDESFDIDSIVGFDLKYSTDKGELIAEIFTSSGNTFSDSIDVGKFTINYSGTTVNQPSNPPVNPPTNPPTISDPTIENAINNNYTYIQQVDAEVQKGWDVSVNGGAPANIQMGDKVNFTSSDNNLVFGLISSTDSSTGVTTNTIDVKLSDDISVNNITTEQIILGDNNSTTNNTTNISYNGNRITYQEGNTTQYVANLNDGLTFAGDSGSAEVDLNKQVKIYGGATEYATGNNIGVVASSDGANGAKLEVKLAKDLTGLNFIETKTITATETIKVGDSTSNVTINNKSIQLGDVQVSYNEEKNLTVNNKKITNVAPGEISETSTDVVVGKQLYQVQQEINAGNAQLSNRLDRLGNRVDKVGAGAAALAALHPLDFDPDDKLQFSAGVGNYRGETAAALGAFYRPTEKVMFSVAGTMGNDDNMVSAGVTFALDRKNNVSNSRVAMAHEIKDLREQVAALTALVSQIAGKGNPLLDTVMFPDVPENHWAYDYVESLQKRGIIEGYPDGNFAGDRSMTRYEYAAMLYRALEKGFPVDGRLLKEFEAELGRIRIDRIKGTDDDANKVERVRVNDYEGRDDYGSKLAQVVADAAPVVEEEPAA